MLNSIYGHRRTIMRKLIDICNTRLLEDIDIDPFIRRLHSVASLAMKAGTEGERQAAVAAFNRFRDIATKEIEDESVSSVKRERLAAEFNDVIQKISSMSPMSVPTKKAWAPKEPEPVVDFQEGDWVVKIGTYKIGRVVGKEGNLLDVQYTGSTFPRKVGPSFLRKATDHEINVANRK